MHPTPPTTPRRRRGGLVAVLAVAALALVAGLLVPAMAGAQETGDEPAATERAHRPRLTDEQRQCLQDQGLEQPARGERPTDAQRQAFRDAAEECGIDPPEPRDS